MKPLTGEWVAKAEADFATCERESRARKHPNYDGICFHAQQCAEKYIKALLCENGIEFGKSHDLVSLLEQALPVAPLWEAHRKDLAFLTDFAVLYRYPGEMANRDMAREARLRCRAFRLSARTTLRLSALR